MLRTCCRSTFGMLKYAHGKDGDFVMSFGGTGGGGSGSISTSSDVALSNPGNNDVPAYDSSVGKWKNKTPTAGTVADGSITDAKIASGAAIAIAKLAIDPTLRSNHTGTQPATTITGLAA